VEEPFPAQLKIPSLRQSSLCLDKPLLYSGSSNQAGTQAKFQLSGGKVQVGRRTFRLVEVGHCFAWQSYLSLLEIGNKIITGAGGYWVN